MEAEGDVPVSYTIYSITGCTRCKILKQCMSENGIAYVEKDSQAEGKEEFQKFYGQNRKSIVRGSVGIEFPILANAEGIWQGLTATLAQVLFRNKLDGFVSVGTLHKEWVDGLHISGGNPVYADEFIHLLHYIKGNNMQLQVDTDGRNPDLLQRVLAENIISVLILNAQSINSTDIRKSLELIVKFPIYKIHTTVSSATTPAEVGEIARMIGEVTGNIKTPYYLFAACKDEAINLLSHRSAARKYLVLADIETEST